VDRARGLSGCQAVELSRCLQGLKAALVDRSLGGGGLGIGEAGLGSDGQGQDLKIVWDASRPSPSLPPFSLLIPYLPFSPSLPSPLRSRHAPIAARGSGGALKLSSGSGRSPAAKRSLTHLRPKFVPF